MLLTSKISFFPFDEYGIVGTEVHLLDMYRVSKERLLRIPYEEFKAGWKLYNEGELIQNAFPSLNDSDREFLLTGLTDDEWDDMWRENGR